ncbi:MAG TPA: phosphoribosylanthranilate isomerase, partial [Clostridia bacterium]|nr:phosphoribosylanthranilate isomerase [Clostridia bacterium]
ATIPQLSGGHNQFFIDRNRELSLCPGRDMLWGEMPVKVKICGITNVADARAAAEAGADAIGLMFWEQSPRFVDLERAAEISRVLPPYVLRTGVFVNASEDLVLQAIASCGLNLLQFHGDEPPDFCGQFGLMSMKAFRVRDAASLEVLPSYQTEAWLLDAFTPGKLGGTGESFNWDLAIEAAKWGRPFFLAGGLHAGNVAEAVRRVRPYGVDVSSGVESAPGKKDPEKVRAFVKAAREASL